MPKSLEEALRADPPCYPRACAIQTCLQKSNYDESRCAHLIDALYECCAEMYKREGPGAKNTTCCPKESLLELKMKQRAEEKAKGTEGGVARARRN